MSSPSPVNSPSILKAFKEKLIEFLKSYRISIPANAIYLIICLIITSMHLSGNYILGDHHLNDFSVYYYAAQELFKNPARIYDELYLEATYNVYAFRYFPAMLAYIFYPLTALPLVPAYALFTVLSYILNLANVYLVMAILRKFAKNFNQKVIEIFAAAMLVLPFWVDFYVAGQISCLLVFVLLLSMHFYLKGREVLGSLLLGISLVLKPITFFQIIFILVSALLAKDIKSVIKRGIFILIPLIPDALLFLGIDGLLEGFLQINFATTSPAIFSVSFANFFVSVLNLHFRWVFFTCLGVSVFIGILILRKIKNPQDRILFAFIFGTFGYFLTQIDIWTNQFPLVFPFLILAAGFLPKYIDQKRFFILYLIYPAAAQFYNLYFAFSNIAEGNAAIMPFIPIVSFSLLLLVAYYAWMMYSSDKGNIPDAPRTSSAPLTKNGT